MAPPGKRRNEEEVEAAPHQGDLLHEAAMEDAAPGGAREPLLLGPAGGEGAAEVPRDGEAEAEAGLGPEAEAEAGLDPDGASQADTDARAEADAQADSDPESVTEALLVRLSLMADSVDAVTVWPGFSVPTRLV